MTENDNEVNAEVQSNEQESPAVASASNAQQNADNFAERPSASDHESELSETLGDEKNADMLPPESDPAAHDDQHLADEGASEEIQEPTQPEDMFGGHDPAQLKEIFEAALFASGTTLSVQHLRDLFAPEERPHASAVKQLMVEVVAYYQGRGVELVEVASGYRFQTKSDTAQWVSRLWDEKPQRYSRALLETTALIAYRQPITRGEIEDVRGVAVSSHIIRTLLEREWVRVVGHRDVPGRPAMYATTKQFLDYFGLNNLDQLPSLSDIRDLEELDPQLSLQDGSGEPNADAETQEAMSFSEVINDIREHTAQGKTGNEYLDEQLDDELKAMDDVNKNFEAAMEQQRAEREHPALNLDQEDAESESASEELSSQNPSSTETSPEEPNGSITQQPEQDDATAMDEAEKWKIIQEKLAQQEALLAERDKAAGDEGEVNE